MRGHPAGPVTRIVPRCALVGGMIALGLATATGCVEGDGTSGTAGGTAVSATTRPAPSATDGRGIVTITRTGGIIGYDDRVSVAPSGAVTATRKGVAVSCSVPVTVAYLLATGAASAAPAPTRSGSDVIHVTISSDGRTTPLGEGGESDELSRVVAAILADLGLPAEERTTCR